MAVARERHQRARLEKTQAPELLFSTNSSTKYRPTSVHTEFMETDWEMEDDDEASEFEDDEHIFGESSPRASLDSVNLSDELACHVD